jgi:hypothetical protein
LGEILTKKNLQKKKKENLLNNQANGVFFKALLACLLACWGLAV